MKKILVFVIGIMLCMVAFLASACRTGKIIRPLYEKVDMNKLPDGIYPVEFTKDSVVNDNLLKVKVFSEDVYDTVDLHNIQVGDRIEKGGKIEDVTKVVWDDGHSVLAINYWDNVSDADERFVPAESGGIYLVKGPDDHSTYTPRGNSKVIISEHCVVTDTSDLEKPMASYKGIQEVIDYIRNSDSYFNCLNTRIRIENGEVVEINRRYIP